MLSRPVAKEDSETIVGFSAVGQDANGKSPSQDAEIRIDRRVLRGIVIAVLILALFVALAATNTPRSVHMKTSTASTSIYSSAEAIVASVVQTSPAGFVNETSKQATSSTGDWALLEASDGSEANITVIVYPSFNASQSYFNRLVANVEGLPGYSNISPQLTAFQGYGTCYGYGEDVDGIAVVNGVCTKGNAFLQVHLVSSISFSDLEADLTAMMGALYQSAV